MFVLKKGYELKLGTIFANLLQFAALQHTHKNWLTNMKPIVFLYYIACFLILVFYLILQQNKICEEDCGEEVQTQIILKPYVVQLWKV